MASSSSFQSVDTAMRMFPHHNVSISATTFCGVYYETQWNSSDYPFIEGLTTDCLRLLRTENEMNSHLPQQEWCQVAKGCFATLFFQLWNHTNLQMVISFYDLYLVPLIIFLNVIPLGLLHLVLDRVLQPRKVGANDGNGNPISIGVIPTSNSTVSGYGYLLKWSVVSLLVCEGVVRGCQYLSLLHPRLQWNATRFTCPVVTFLRQVAENVPQWMLLLFCVDRSIAQWNAHQQQRHLQQQHHSSCSLCWCPWRWCWTRRGRGRCGLLGIFPVSRLGAGLTATFVLVLIVIVNVHSLWMTIFIHESMECKQGNILDVGLPYHLFLKVAHWVVPSTAGLICGIILLLTQCSNSSSTAPYHTGTRGNIPSSRVTSRSSASDALLRLSTDGEAPSCLLGENNDSLSPQTFHCMATCLALYLPICLLPQCFTWFYAEIWSTTPANGAASNQSRPQPAPFASVYGLLLHQFLVNRIYSEAFCRVIVVPLLCLVSPQLRSLMMKQVALAGHWLWKKIILR